MRSLGISVLLLLAWLALPPAASAQEVARTPRIGFLSPFAATTDNGMFAEAFRQGLRELGYDEGRNIRIEYRWADGRFDELPSLARELVRLDVDVIVALVTQASVAAKAATTRIPIVMANVGDPIGAGLVGSLARPGGNVTGTSGMVPDVVGKQMEIIKELMPGVDRLAVLSNPDNPVFQAQQLEAAKLAGRSVGLDLEFFETRRPDEFASVFAAMSGNGARAVLVLGDPALAPHYEAMAEEARQHRVAAVGGNRRFADLGGLLSFGSNYEESVRRAAVYVHRILKGSTPADMPVEQPTRFELVVNLKTARALGVIVPHALLLRADEVIE